MSNQEKIHNNLTKLKDLEQRINNAGMTTVKPLAKELAKLTRITLALIAGEVFANG